jgi:homoserine dehydrogenase
MIKVALCGYGTIGHGVKALLDGRQDVVLVKVLDLPNKKAELGSLLVIDYHAITDDPSIDVVIECLGGDTLPHLIISASLKAGKAVISSNKETIATHYAEYAALAEHYHASLQFEASVGGGIPLLYPLAVLSRFDSVSSLQGILNGTTNFILSKMEEGALFADALKEAQARGFAEKDPSADLQGLDLVRKAAILAMLLYHQEVALSDIPHFGIEALPESLGDIEEKEGRKLKLIVDIRPHQKGLSILIAPTLLKPDDLLSSIKEETNAVKVEAKANGPLLFAGKGAGEFPTASAMISDLERVIAKASLPLVVPKKKVPIIPDLRGRYYVSKDQKSLQILVDPSLEELKTYRFIAKVAE